MSEVARDEDRRGQSDVSRSLQAAAFDPERQGFMSTLSDLGEAIIGMDASGCILRMNHAAEALTGWSRVEARGRAATEVLRFVDAETHAEVESPIVRTLRRGEAVGLDDDRTLLLSRDGTEHPIAARLAPDRDAAGGIVGAVMAFRDRTEERRLRATLGRAEQESRVLFDDAPIGSAMLDLEGRFLRVNRAFCRMLGYAAQELHGLPWTSVIHGDDLAANREATRGLLAGERVFWVIDERYVGKDGKPVWAHVTERLQRDPEGRPLCILLHVEDITERKLAEAERQAAQQLFVDIVEFLPDATFVIDQDKRLIAWNHACEAMTGVRKETVLGRGDYAYSEPFFGVRRPILLDLMDSPVPEVEATYKYIRREGAVIYAESFVPHLREGHGAHLWVSATPLFDGKGRRCGAIEVVRDVTEQKRVEHALRESEQKFRTLFESADDAIMLMRGDRFIACNARALTLFRARHEEIVDASWYRFSPPIQPGGQPSEERAREKIGLAVSNRPQRFEWKHRRADGTEFDAEVSLNGVEVGGEVLLQAIIRDVTERRAAEEQVRRLNSELLRQAEALEQRVAERTADLVAARDQAESADRFKSAFLATMSHELRTPLNSIIGFSAILLEGLAGPLNEEQSKQMGMVCTASEHLLALINDVLDLSKIEAGQLTTSIEPFDLRASIGRVIDTVRPLAEKRGLALDVDVAAEVTSISSDRRRVEQVLFNLLSNAIKFTERGRVRVEASRRDARVAIRVTDTGMGIKDQDLGTLFKPFRQVDTGLARKYEGTGLGLSICKKLVELLGGAIEVKSEWGKGSTFGFDLPIEGVSRESKDPLH